MQRTMPRGKARTEGPALALDLHGYLLCLNADKPTCSAWKPGLTHKAKRHVLKKKKKKKPNTCGEEEGDRVSIYVLERTPPVSPAPPPAAKLGAWPASAVICSPSLC